jgi:hypothetical protein
MSKKRSSQNESADQSAKRTNGRVTSTYSETPCTVCRLHHGHTDGKCSVCYYASIPVHARPVIPKVHNRWVMGLDDFTKWVETGVHCESDGTCSSCSEQKMLISNYCCKCLPVTCTDCNKGAVNCPLCGSGKYVRLSKESIKSLLVNMFDRSSITRAALEAIRSGKIETQLRFEQLICLASDVDEVVTELNLDLEARCEEVKTIYCFAVNYFDLTIDAAYVIYYKGFDGWPLTYENVNEHRLMADNYGVMSTTIPF